MCEGRNESHHLYIVYGHSVETPTSANPHGANLPNMLSLHWMLALFGMKLEREKRKVTFVCNTYPQH